MLGLEGSSKEPVTGDDHGWPESPEWIHDTSCAIPPSVEDGNWWKFGTYSTCGLRTVKVCRICNGFVASSIFQFYVLFGDWCFQILLPQLGSGGAVNQSGLGFIVFNSTKLVSSEVSSQWIFCSSSNSRAKVLLHLPHDSHDAKRSEMTIRWHAFRCFKTLRYSIGTFEPISPGRR